jgi:hypothetical protein
LSDRRRGVFYISVKGLFWVDFVERALGLFLVASAKVTFRLPKVDGGGLLQLPLTERVSFKTRLQGNRA